MAFNRNFPLFAIENYSAVQASRTNASGPPLYSDQGTLKIKTKKTLLKQK